mgnify:CR=1 FL=1
MTTGLDAAFSVAIETGPDAVVRCRRWAHRGTDATGSPADHSDRGLNTGVSCQRLAADELVEAAAVGDLRWCAAGY